MEQPKKDNKTMKKCLQDTFVLYNGVQIPCIGYGTYKMTDSEQTTNAILNAIECGYRHIDTAAFYQNERNVGQAVRECGLKREELFITSKLWRSDRGYKNALNAFERTMSALKLDYLDLYLVHWPAPKKENTAWEQENIETWQALTELYQQGKVRAIGVSNFLPHHLNALLNASIKPMVNQIQFHPAWAQFSTLEVCKQNGILVEGWSPLGRGMVLDHPTLLSLAQKYQKTPAQLCVRWCLERGVLPLPKTVSQNRMQENANVFDFTIDGEDMHKIDEVKLDGFTGHNPDLM